MKAQKMSMLAAVFACACTAIAAEPLTVDRSGAAVIGEKLEYNGITLHGDYTIGAGASVTNVGSYLEIGPDAGDNPVMTVKDGGQYTTKDEGQSSAKVIRFGQNGGAGKIVVSDVATPSDPKRNKSGWNYNNYTFGAMAWNLMLAEGASATSDTMDIVRIDTNAFFSVWCVSNRNTQVKARILFNGGTYYMHSRMRGPIFAPVPGSEIILEGVNGNDVDIMSMSSGLVNLVGYKKNLGFLRFRGDNDVILNGTDSASGTMRPAFRLTECCKFEQKGDLVAKGFMKLLMDGSYRLPYGPETGKVILQDAGTLLDLSGTTVLVNGLQGCGSVTNASASTVATVVVSNATDTLCSELLSSDLKWCDSDFGVVCVKKGEGLLLADSMPSAPMLTIEAGGVKTTAAATPETMKGQVVEFKEGTTLTVAGGTYTAANTILPPTVPVTIAAGATFRAQAGDSALNAPNVAVGGTVEKTGAGTLRIYDAATAFAGTICAHGGTVKLSGRGDTNDFWRLTILQGVSTSVTVPENQYVRYLSDILLLDANDALAYSTSKMKQTTFGTAAKDLQPGEATVPEGTEMSGSYTDLKYLFDNGRWSDVNFPTAFPKLEDETSWFPITFRLPTGHAAVHTFKLRHGWGGSEYTQQAWRLESSPDGVTWQTVSERLGGPTIGYPDDGIIANDPKVRYADNVSIGLAETAVLRADAGATVDLSGVAEGSAPCGGLEVDYAQGGGTITRFEPVANGVLKIVNYPAGTSIGGYELPLTFGSTGDMSNLATWKLFVNGVEKSNGIDFVDGKIRIRKSGLMLIVQ